MVFIATSLDGFIARLDGTIDWLALYAPPSQNEDYGYAAFMDEVDTLVMGRKTFEAAAGFPEWPYQGKRVLVLTKGSLNVPPELRRVVTTTSAAPRDIVDTLHNTGSRNVYVDGGQTIQAFLKAVEFQEITITRLPRLIGSGIPLFGII